MMVEAVDATTAGINFPINQFVGFCDYLDRDQVLKRVELTNRVKGLHWKV